MFSPKEFADYASLKSEKEKTAFETHQGLLKCWLREKWSEKIQIIWSFVKDNGLEPSVSTIF